CLRAGGFSGSGIEPRTSAIATIAPRWARFAWPPAIPDFSARPARQRFSSSDPRQRFSSSEISPHSELISCETSLDAVVMGSCGSRLRTALRSSAHQAVRRSPKSRWWPVP
ncbi:MAG: hypothetical protein ACK559_22710, partial [bacterium]